MCAFLSLFIWELLCQFLQTWNKQIKESICCSPLPGKQGIFLFFCGGMIHECHSRVNCYLEGNLSGGLNVQFGRTLCFQKATLLSSSPFSDETSSSEDSSSSGEEDGSVCSSHTSSGSRKEDSSPGSPRSLKRGTKIGQLNCPWAQRLQVSIRYSSN